MWPIPNYIKSGNMLDEPIQHDWNDKDTLAYYREDQGFERKIGKISNRGIVGLSAGFAEWIAWRLQKHCDNPVLFQEIEAVWAGIVDWKYMRPLHPSLNAPDGELWLGKSKGPVCEAYYCLLNIVGRTKISASTLGHASSLSQLALHVLPSSKAFKDWRRQIVERLVDCCPRDTNARLGTPIPREVLDPNYDYKPEMAKNLISKYLENLDCKSNPFLRSPEEMKKEGFEGVPYRF